MSLKRWRTVVVARGGERKWTWMTGLDVSTPPWRGCHAYILGLANKRRVGFLFDGTIGLLEVWRSRMMLCAERCWRYQKFTVNLIIWCWCPVIVFWRQTNGIGDSLTLEVSLSRDVGVHVLMYMTRDRFCLQTLPCPQGTRRIGP